ncbi:hypothetical protein [Thalassobacillus hwangdonensis]|uniref:Uncharacterized protein n=1 Tax=Thalassobacillus hwangdonensis TaxID=546108 RepID=A0ABW3L3T4_9BACI
MKNITLFVGCVMVVLLPVTAHAELLLIAEGSAGMFSYEVKMTEHQKMIWMIEKQDRVLYFNETPWNQQHLEDYKSAIDVVHKERLKLIITLIYLIGAIVALFAGSKLKVRSSRLMYYALVTLFCMITIYTIIHSSVQLTDAYHLANECFALLEQMVA